MNHRPPGDRPSLPHQLLNRSGNHRLPDEEEGRDNAGVGHAEVKWCTLSCEHADWPRDHVDGAKSCRTFNAVWCRALEQHVTRNTPCALEHGARRPKPNW